MRGEEVDVEVRDACQQKLTSVLSEDSALRSAGVRSARVSEDYLNHYGGLVPVNSGPDMTDLTEPAEGGDESSGTMPCAKSINSSDPSEVAKGRGVRPATVCASQHPNVSPESPCGEEVRLEGVGACQPKSRTRILSEDSARTSVGVPSTRVLSIKRITTSHGDKAIASRVCIPQHSNMSPESPCGEEVRLEGVGASQPKEAIASRALAHANHDNSSGDLNCCEIRKSEIAGAGLGLFATKIIKKGQRVTMYSSKPISAAQARVSSSSYLLYVNSKLTLDADGPGHMAGRFINDGRIVNRTVNVRFGASLVTYKCKVTVCLYQEHQIW